MAHPPNGVVAAVDNIIIASDIRFDSERFVKSNVSICCLSRGWVAGLARERGHYAFRPDLLDRLVQGIGDEDLPSRASERTCASARFERANSKRAVREQFLIEPPTEFQLL
jgi:hypothetical protein